MPRCIAVLVAVAALVAATPAPTHAHNGNPNYLSEVESAPEGVTVDVLNRDDRLLLTNASDEDIVIEGYNEEPYARIAADGTVSVNRNSPAYYLNEERFGGAEAPEEVRENPQAEPDWERIDGSGRFEWHDHRAHWMGSERPAQVKDPGQRTAGLRLVRADEPRPDHRDALLDAQPGRADRLHHHRLRRGADPVRGGDRRAAAP